MKRSSVRPSVCLICRLQQRRVAGLLLSAPPAQDIDGQQSPALSSKCERCHVDSRWTRLNADLFFSLQLESHRRTSGDQRNYCVCLLHRYYITTPVLSRGTLHIFSLAGPNPAFL